MSCTIIRHLSQNIASPNECCDQKNILKWTVCKATSMLIVIQQLPTQDIAANILKRYAYINTVKTVTHYSNWAIPTWWQTKSKAKGPHQIICDASNRNRTMVCRLRNRPKSIKSGPKLTNKTVLILSILNVELIALSPFKRLQNIEYHLINQ
jgi:hypothetical protein